jgi:hypothetical protein
LKAKRNKPTITGKKPSAAFAAFVHLPSSDVRSPVLQRHRIKTI